MLLTKDKKQRQAKNKRYCYLYDFSPLVPANIHTLIHTDNFANKHTQGEKGRVLLISLFYFWDAMSRFGAHQSNFVSERLRDLKFLNQPVCHRFSFLMEVFLLSQKNQLASSQ